MALGEPTASINARALHTSGLTSSTGSTDVPRYALTRACMETSLGAADILTLASPECPVGSRLAVLASILYETEDLNTAAGFEPVK